MKPVVKIYEMCDGYTIVMDDKTYAWDHNDEAFTEHLSKR